MSDESSQEVKIDVSPPTKRKYTKHKRPEDRKPYEFKKPRELWKKRTGRPPRDKIVIPKEPKKRGRPRKEIKVGYVPVPLEKRKIRKLGIKWKAKSPEYKQYMRDYMREYNRKKYRSKKLKTIPYILDTGIKRSEVLAKCKDEMDQKLRALRAQFRLEKLKLKKELLAKYS